MITTYAIEGIDGLGKSTLIEGILQKCGFHQVIHFAKPRMLQAYITQVRQSLGDVDPEAELSEALRLYQGDCFETSMRLAASGAKIIFDRWHLGECVYAPVYRGYSGDFVFSLEGATGLNYAENVRLILLTEDFKRSTHFVDDGNALGPADRETRAMEQEIFVNAFNRSRIRDKRQICVTGEDGKFRSKDAVLLDALV